MAFNAYSACQEFLATCVLCFLYSYIFYFLFTKSNVFTAIQARIKFTQPIFSSHTRVGRRYSLRRLLTHEQYSVVM